MSEEKPVKHNGSFAMSLNMFTIFRMIVSVLLILHGLARIWAGTVNDFGGFLTSRGFPAGPTLAWSITIFEIIGGLLMAYGIWKKWIACIFAVELTFGIALVHAKNGWFVVGYSLNGVEYSVLLISSLLLIAFNDRNSNLKS